MPREEVLGRDVKELFVERLAAAPAAPTAWGCGSGDAGEPRRARSAAAVTPAVERIAWGAFERAVGCREDVVVEGALLPRARRSQGNATGRAVGGSPRTAQLRLRFVSRKAEQDTGLLPQVRSSPGPRALGSRVAGAAGMHLRRGAE
jgi:hypothetical protein